MSLLSVRDLSTYINVKDKTIYYLVNNGLIPHYRLGRLIRFKQEEIDAWINSKKAKYISRKIDNSIRSVYTPSIGRPGHLNVKEVIDCYIKEVRSGG
jgi:excisionase family DNA binding protein